MVADTTKYKPVLAVRIESSERIIMTDLITSFPETTTVAIIMNDRLARRIVLLADNNQSSIVASWIEEDSTVVYDMQVSNSELYQALLHLPQFEFLQLNRGRL